MAPQLRIATRGSPLARWQADHVAELLADAVPGVITEIVVVSTEGDRRKDVPLTELGGKGVFVKEIQAAVLEGSADIAVHSAKDLPALTPDGLQLAAVPRRADARDALVGSALGDLGPGASVGTGSARREAQLRSLRPDLDVTGLRGNIATRLSKVGELDAVVIAAAALHRLGQTELIDEALAVDVMIPQVGQGALAIESRLGELVDELSAIEHAASRRCVDAERAFLAELGGDCDLPAGAHARLVDGDVVIGAVLEVDGELRRADRRGSDARSLGREVARAVLA